MDELRFDGQVAVVTGAGRNLGRQYARFLASRGARVVVNDLGVAISDTDGSGDAPPVNPAVDVVAEIEAAGGVAVADTHSVATVEGGAAIMATAMDAFGTIDIVINNAGVVRAAAFPDLEPELTDPVIATQLKAVFNVTRPAWKVMAAKGYGRVLNVSSGSAFGGTPGHIVYGACKMAVVGATRQMATEGRPAGIMVNAIAPYAKTRLGTPFGAIPWSDELGEWLGAAQIAPLVALLCHRRCPSTGECFSVGGGLVSRLVVSTTEGIFERDTTPEVLLARWDEIMDTGGLRQASFDTVGDIARILEPFVGP